MTQQTFKTTRVLIGLDEFLAATGSNTVVCVDQGILGALRVLIRSYGLRKVNWVESYNDAGYISPSDANWDIIDSKISEFLEETTMGLCEDLTTAIQLIADSLAQGCCQTGTEGRGSRGMDGADSPETGEFDDGSNVPPGFPDRATYEAYKCNQSNLIFSDWLDDVGWLKAGTIVTLTASALIVAILTPLPGDEILLFIGYLLALLAQGLLVGTGDDIITALTADQDTLVCELYDAFDVDAARTAVENWASVNLTAIQETFFLFFLSNDALNRLFVFNVADSNRSPNTTPTDCDACASCEQNAFDRGSESPQFTFHSEWSGSHTQLLVYFNSTAPNFGSACGPEVKGIPTFNFGAADRFIIRDSAGTTIYDEVVIWTDPEQAGRFFQIQLTSVNTPFELDWQYEEV